MASIWFTLTEFTQTQIQALGLQLPDASPLPDAQVYLRRLVVDRDIVLPCIQVAPGDREEELDGSTEDLEVRFPVAVAFIVAVNQDYTLVDVDLPWREAIMDAFADQTPVKITLPDANVSDLQIEPLAVTDMDAWRNQNLVMGGMLFNYRVNRIRKNR